MELNLPQTYTLNLKQTRMGLQVYDQVRKKYILLTPEEYVRQQYVHFLIHHKGYRPALMRIESGFQYDARTKRSDIQVYLPSGKLWAIVECKRADLALDPQAWQQLTSYQKSLDAQWLVLTNGMEHKYAQKDMHGLWSEHFDFPDFPDLTNFTKFQNSI